jgi:hypothetical protein
MRKRPSPATVLALIALFVSLSGTAIASVIITSNSQVAAHVISGAAGPSGDHKNLILGSIASSDLHAGAVTGTKLAKASVATSKLNLPKIATSVANTDANDGAPHHTLLSLDGVTLGLSCFAPSTGAVDEKLFLTGPTGEFRGTEAAANSPGTSTDSVIVQTTPDANTAFVDLHSSGTGNLYEEFQITYHNANRVITLFLDASVQGTSKLCDVYGTAVPAPN